MSDLIHHINLLYSLSGLLIGALVGITGVAGGSLMTPLLVLLFGIHPATAVGTDLLYAGLTKMVGTAVHGRNRTIAWRITGLLACGSVPASIVTLLVLAHFGKGGEGSGPVVNAVLGAALILTAVALMFRQHILGALSRFTERLTAAAIGGLTVALGAVLGVLVSISSIGAGAIGVTALILLYPRLPVARLVGSDIAHAVPLTLVAGTGHWIMGSVDWTLLASLLVGSVPGIAVGSQLAGHVPDRVLRPILASTLVVVGGRLAF